MDKIIHLESHFPTGELTVQPVLLWANGKACYEEITKYASVGHDFFKTVTPVPGHSFVYVLAVSAWEAYGENRNDDAFPEFPYMETASPPWIAADETLTHYYKTFEQFGNVFRHHANKIPEKAIGKIVKAFWNPPMHRVELLLDIENAKAPDLIDRVISGEYPPTSMGCRVPYDVCFLPNMLTRTSLGHRRIIDVQKGETVRTHRGRLKKVIKHFVRTVEGYATLQGWGTLKTDVSLNHPFYVIKKEEVTTVRRRKGTTRHSDRVIMGIPDWVTVEDMRLGDFVGIPLDSSSSVSNIGINRARLLGFYIGDGCPHYYRYKGKKIPTHVVLSLNKEETAIREQIEVAALTCMSSDKIVEYPYKKKGNIKSGFGAGKKTKGTRLYLNDRTLAAWCIQQGGTKAHEKWLSEDVFSWSEEEKLSLLGGYIDSDGCYYAERNYTVISTVNPGLALDIQRLGLSVGIPISLNHTDKSSHGYEIFIPGAFSVLLSKYSVKVLPVKTKAASRLKGFFYQGYWWTPVRKLEQHDGTVEVHNLSVEEDESYIINGIAVHNCTICGNRAPTRAQYCNHLRFQAREVINGKKVAALNPRPKFFDQSFVFRPADPMAFMMKKVAEARPYEITGAEAGEYLNKVSAFKDAAHKIAVIDKLIQGIPMGAREAGMDPVELQNMQRCVPLAAELGRAAVNLPDEFLQGLSNFSMPQIFSTMAARGMAPTTPEVVKITIIKVYKQLPAPELLDKSVALQHGIFELLEDHPQVIQQLMGSGALSLDSSQVHPGLFDALAPLMEKRSGIGEYLKRRIVPESWRDESPYSSQMTLTDPATGQSYATTRGAAISAHDEIAKRNLYKVLGGTALLGAGYKVVGHMLGPGRAWMKPLTAAGLGALGLANLPSMGPHYMTDQGVPIPANTELAKMSSIGGYALPAVGTLGIMALLGQDYNSRMQDGIPMGHPGLPVTRRGLDWLEETTHEHPLISAGVGALGLHMLGRSPLGQWGHKRLVNPLLDIGGDVAGKAKGMFNRVVHGETKLSAYLGRDIPIPMDTVLLPEIDLDRLAEKIGELIVEG